MKPVGWMKANQLPPRTRTISGDWEPWSYFEHEQPGSVALYTADQIREAVERVREKKIGSRDDGFASYHKLLDALLAELLGESP